MGSYLEDAEILLKNYAKPLQKLLTARIHNITLDRWSLELQGRNITVEHTPSIQNKAAVFLSRLPYITRKRNDHPLYAIDFSHASEITITFVNQISSKHENRLCEIDLTSIGTL